MSIEVIKFGANWCKPCKKIDPLFESLKKKYTDVKFIKYDNEKHEDFFDAYNIEVLPTIVFMHKGIEVSRFKGADEEGLTKMIRDVYAKHG